MTAASEYVCREYEIVETLYVPVAGPARVSHHYIRNGTTSLFATFDVRSGSVIATHYALTADVRSAHTRICAAS